MSSHNNANKYKTKIARTHRFSKHQRQTMQHSSHHKNEYTTQFTQVFQSIDIGMTFGRSSLRLSVRLSVCLFYQIAVSQRARMHIDDQFIWAHIANAPARTRLCVICSSFFGFLLYTSFHFVFNFVQFKSNHMEWILCVCVCAWLFHIVSIYSYGRVYLNFSENTSRFVPFLLRVLVAPTGSQPLLIPIGSLSA